MMMRAAQQQTVIWVTAISTNPATLLHYRLLASSSTAFVVLRERERERERKRVESGESSEVFLECALLQSIRQPESFPHSSTPCCFVCHIICCCCCRLQLLLLARSFVFLESHVIFCSWLELSFVFKSVILSSCCSFSCFVFLFFFFFFPALLCTCGWC